MAACKVFELGDFALQKSAVLPDAKVVYATLGRRNEARDSAVLFPTWAREHRTSWD